MYSLHDKIISSCFKLLQVINTHHGNIDNKYILDETYSNEFAKIFRPDIKNNTKNSWQGRLCWDIPFICSYKNLNIYRKNNYLFLIE